MSSNKYPLASFDLGRDLIIPEGQGTGDGVFKALTRGQLPSLQTCIAPFLQSTTKRQMVIPRRRGGLRRLVSANQTVLIAGSGRPSMFLPF